MDNILIIDSNKTYAGKLGAMLNVTLIEDVNFWDSSKFSDLGKLSDEIKEKSNEEAVVLINAEAVTNSGFIQDQELIELAFWLRCKHKMLNAMVFYSTQSVNHLLKTRPQNLILVSPGCYFLRFPIGKEQIDKIPNFKPLESINLIKLYLKPRINLERTRHRYANYAGMNLMLSVAKSVFDLKSDDMVLGANSKNNKDFAGFYKFLNSLDNYLLETFYNLNTSVFVKDNDKPKLKIIDAKRILLIDDLADKGWKSIIRQMVYGNDPNGKSEIMALTDSDPEKLKKAIDDHKPHIIILDLRLDDEEGKKKITKLGGYKLLKFLKNDPDYKGLPVIMFTASSNAETTKKLIELGAESVWAKPGIDEGLNAGQIVERYRLLIDHINNGFSKFDSELSLQLDNDIDEARVKILQKTEFFRYRAGLNKSNNSSHYFNSFTDIFIDTNIAEVEAETLCNLYKLAQICGKTTHKIIVDRNSINCNSPKVVFHNFVINELILHSKAGKPKKSDHFWKIGLIAYEVVRGLFQDDLIRTQYNKIEDNKPVSVLKREVADREADPYIREEIIKIVLGQNFQISGRNVKYETLNPKILLISNDNGLKSILKAELSALATINGSVKMINSLEFNREIGKIEL